MSELQREIERWIAAVTGDGAMSGPASVACKNIVWKLERENAMLLKALKGMVAERESDGHAHSGMSFVWLDKARAAIAAVEAK